MNMTKNWTLTIFDPRCYKRALHHMRAWTICRVFSDLVINFIEIAIHGNLTFLLCSVCIGKHGGSVMFSSIRNSIFCQTFTLQSKRSILGQQQYSDALVDVNEGVWSGLSLNQIGPRPSTLNPFTYNQTTPTTTLICNERDE